MIDDRRLKTTAQEHIRSLFSQTEGESLKITYYPAIEEPFTLTYKVDWSRRDAENLVRQFESLTSTLSKLGGLYDKLADAENRRKLLSAEELRVWETYLRPYEPFEVDLSVISELFLRSEFDELSDEENELLERHAIWLEEQSRKRLPFTGRCPKYLIDRANRYARLTFAGAPGVIIEEEGRCLAEEMILYYFSK